MWPELSVPARWTASKKAGRTRLLRPNRASMWTASALTSSSTTFGCCRTTVQDTEFAIIAALQYIRYLNARRQSITIHGANLSLSIPHDVRNYACGRTPVCDECERLVDSGVVVVAAAGNFGYQSFTTKEGAYEGYAAFSVTDPGNADGVITVGLDPSRFAAHLRRQLLLESRADRRRPPQARSRRSRRTHSRARSAEAAGAISTARAWPRRTSAGRRRC